MVQVEVWEARDPQVQLMKGRSVSKSRQVETFSAEAHNGADSSEFPCHGFELLALFGHMAQEELSDAEVLPHESANSNKEDEHARTTRETRGFGVQVSARFEGSLGERQRSGQDGRVRLMKPQNAFARFRRKRPFSLGALGG
jgi:hypothetical protein